ncbi:MULTISPECIES: hypothetical protein [Sorangium]|uniref:Secreted protein n=1 Tax=Sorangium cellulosum TaxID=56 RepID=A0A4P2QUG9_SORCE|nr:MULTISPECIES: hypothetical protein [Sorangium]AUX33776.1 hypothetical protein SOCE836_059400 [Sorangium cellulosum]WCQ93085.1 hypothetical protein NQZ70_05833 [Sorangium sp. Soce836]
MAIQKKRKVLRTPFVVTVAAAASFAGAVALPGCDPTVQDGSCPAERPAEGSSCDADDVSCTYPGTCGDDTFRFTCEDGAWQMGVDPTCNPPPPACPEERPEAGSSCTAGGLSCSYLDDCDNPIDYTCMGGAWQMGPEMSCNPPPPPECPEATPEDGAPCEGAIGTCGYMMPTGCGPMPIDAACVLEGDTWRWQVHEIFCNPPPPEHCLAAATAEACAGLGPTCQWLVPGCADGDGAPALPAAGCFPSLPCESDDACPAGTLCQEVVVNPCVAASPGGVTCAACGSTKNVCVPPSAATAAGK